MGQHSGDRGHPSNRTPRIIGLVRWLPGPRGGHPLGRFVDRWRHRWWFRWANRAQARGNLEAAIAGFERSLAAGAGIPTAQRAYVHRRLVTLQALRHHWPAMEAHGRRWCALEPACGEAHRQLAESLVRQAKWPEALKRYGIALDVDLALGASLGPAIAQIGDQLSTAKRWSLAAQAFALALRTDPHCDRWHRARIGACFEQRDWPGAIAAAQTLAGSALGAAQRAEGYYWLGRIYDQMPDGPRAIAAYRLALGLGHRSPWTWLNLAAALKTANRLPDSALAYRRGLERWNGQRTDAPPMRLYQQAIAVTEALGDWPALAWLCRTARDRDPQPDAPSVLDRPLAKALEQLGDFTGAIAAYRRALEHQPAPWLWGQLARLLVRTGDWDGAAAAYHQAIAPEESPHPWASAEFFHTWANIWAKGQRWDLAIGALRHAIARLETLEAATVNNPEGSEHSKHSGNLEDSPPAPIPTAAQRQQGDLWITLSQWLAQRQDQPGAIAAALNAIALLPTDDRANLLAANLLAAAERWHEAAPLYWHHATGTTPLALNTWERAIHTLLQVQQPAAAIAIARQALGQHPDCAALALQLGRILQQCQRPTEAIAAYQQAIGRATATQDAPSAAAGYLALAELHLQQGQGDRAAELYQQAATLGEPLPLRHYRQWGKALEQQQQWQAAVDCYQVALAACPPSPQGVHLDWDLGQVLERLDRPAEAAAAYQRAIARTDHAPLWVYQNWAMALKRADRADEAIAALRQALGRAPQDGGLWAQLGHLLLACNDPPAAIVALWQAVALDANHATAIATLLKTLPATDSAAIAIALQRHLTKTAPNPPLT